MAASTNVVPGSIAAIYNSAVAMRRERKTFRDRHALPHGYRGQAPVRPPIYFGDRGRLQTSIWPRYSPPQRGGVKSGGDAERQVSGF
jgi:hypothetical protein